MKAVDLAPPLVVFAAFATACGSPRPTPTPLTEPAGPPPTYGWTPPNSDPPAAPSKTCVASGCGGVECVEAGTEPIGEAPPCEPPAAAKCIAEAKATCEVHPDGQCGWTKTPALTACLEQVGAGAPPVAPATPVPTAPAAKPGVIRLEVTQSPPPAFGASPKPFIVIPNGAFPAQALQLRVGAFVYTVSNGRITGVPAVDAPMSATMVLGNGQEVPVELVRGP